MIDFSEKFSVSVSLGHTVHSTRGIARILEIGRQLYVTRAKRTEIVRTGNHAHYLSRRYALGARTLTLCGARDHRQSERSKTESSLPAWPGELLYAIEYRNKSFGS